jgi:hypothetical protein
MPRQSLRGQLKVLRMWLRKSRSTRVEALMQSDFASDDGRFTWGLAGP